MRIAKLLIDQGGGYAIRIFRPHYRQFDTTSWVLLVDCIKLVYQHTTAAQCAAVHRNVCAHCLLCCASEAKALVDPVENLKIARRR